MRAGDDPRNEANEENEEMRTASDAGADPGTDASTDTGTDTAETVYRSFGDVPDGELLTPADLARLFGRHRESIMRAMRRGDLPIPVRFLGRPRWLAGSIREHVRALEVAAEKQRERSTARLRVVQKG